VSAVTLSHDTAGQGPAVVLVHGHPFDRSMWAPQLAFLSGRFRVVVPDLRGYGQSPAVAGVATMGELAGDVWSLLGELGIENAAVVGLSMGGLVAMEMALARPAAVWALGLIATTARPITEAERAQRLALADEVEAVGMAPVVESMAPRLFGAAPDPGVGARLREMMAANNPVGSAAALRGRAERPDYRDRLRALRIPSFVCTGTSDEYSTEDVTRELVGCLDAPRILSLPDVGHLPNLERTEVFNAQLGEFLDAAWVARG